MIYLFLDYFIDKQLFRLFFLKFIFLKKKEQNVIRVTFRSFFEDFSASLKHLSAREDVIIN